MSTFARYLSDLLSQPHEYQHIFKDNTGQNHQSTSRKLHKSYLMLMWTKKNFNDPRLDGNLHNGWNTYLNILYSRVLWKRASQITLIKHTNSAVQCFVETVEKNFTPRRLYRSTCAKRLCVIESFLELCETDNLMREKLTWPKQFLFDKDLKPHVHLSSLFDHIEFRFGCLPRQRKVRFSTHIKFCPN